jgi:hypothetical protein|tara:strand:- start:203 stop:514 length:312 start_codon:yes stop_codon:yes gene_type:complete
MGKRSETYRADGVTFPNWPYPVSQILHCAVFSRGAMVRLGNWIKDYQPDPFITEYYRSLQALCRSASFSAMDTNRRDNDAGLAQGEWVKTVERDQLKFTFLES